jgi:hypothetical protein
MEEETKWILIGLILIAVMSFPVKEAAIERDIEMASEVSMSNSSS